MVDRQASHQSYTVGLEACAGDQLARVEAAGGTCNPHTACLLHDGGDLGPAPDFAAPGFDTRCHCPADRRIVDNPGRMDEERTEAGDIRLVGSQLRHRQAAVFDAVPARPILEALHSFNLGIVRRHQQFAAGFERNTVFGAERLCRLRSLAAQRRFQGSRRIINPGMDHAAVMARLMTRKLRLLFQEQDPGAGHSVLQRHGRRQADDAASYDAIVVQSATLSTAEGRRPSLSCLDDLTASLKYAA